ncbi:ATP-dependent helicase [uncultured virus]|nr:ATP-dependent helicase [uncultured virus]
MFDHDSTEPSYIDPRRRCVRAAKLVRQYHTEKHDGTYIVFVPAKREVDVVVRSLSKHLGKQIQIIVIYPEFTVKTLNDAMTLSNHRLVLIALASTEHILQQLVGVTLVIDTLAQRSTTSIDEGTELRLEWISLIVSQQRQACLDPCSSNATYHAVCSEVEFRAGSERPNSSLYPFGVEYRRGGSSEQRALSASRTGDQHSIPDVRRMEYTALKPGSAPSHTCINRDLLLMIKHGLDPCLVLDSVIPKHILTLELGYLHTLGLTDTDGMITSMGAFALEFPLSIRKAIMLYYLRQSSDPDMFLFLAVLCTLECYGIGITAMPKQGSNEDTITYTMHCEEQTEVFEAKYGGYSDIDTIFNVWIDICAHIDPLHIAEIRAYSESNGLHLRRMLEITNLIRSCLIIDHKGYVRLGAYHRVRTFKSPNPRRLSRTFNQLLALTHSSFETHVAYNSKGELVANCKGLEYQLDSRSINRLQLGRNPLIISYALVRTHHTCGSEVTRIISAIHTYNEDGVEDNSCLSIFSSDVDSDTELEQTDSTEPRLNMSIDCLPPGLHHPNILRTRSLDAL